MTGANFASLIREYTRTNSVSLPDSKIVLLANVVKDDFAREIAKADEDIGGIPATRDLISSNTSREYSLPNDCLIIKRVEAALDGTNWVGVTSFDLADVPRPSTETQIQQNFGNEEGKAFYDVFRESLWIYSGVIVETDEGLKLWYVEYPADITTDTLALSTDLSADPSTTSWQIGRQFHELWARAVSISWKSNRDKPIPLTKSEQAFGADFETAMSSISNKNKDRELVATMPNNDGSTY